MLVSILFEGLFDNGCDEGKLVFVCCDEGKLVIVCCDEGKLVVVCEVGKIKGWKLGRKVIVGVTTVVSDIKHGV